MSYETKHTPGTFVVHNATDVFSGAVQVCDCNFAHFIVETNTTKADTENGERPYAEAKANAHLFASAPDLLSALIEMISVCEENPSVPGQWWSKGTPTNQQLNIAKSAIEKALNIKTEQP